MSMKSDFQLKPGTIRIVKLFAIMLTKVYFMQYKAHFNGR
jgi:hypothetical protein